jgi:hypothetical protein
LVPVREQFNRRLRELVRTRRLSRYYISPYFEGMRFRVGLRKPYSREDVLEVIRSSVQSEPERSAEWDEIEDSKALATLSLNTPHELLGNTGRLAHLIHHYLNQSQIQMTGEAVAEGERLFKQDRARYEKVAGYLRDECLFLAELYAQWSTIGNRAKLDP